MEQYIFQRNGVLEINNKVSYKLSASSRVSLSSAVSLMSTAETVFDWLNWVKAGRYSQYGVEDSIQIYR